MDQLVKVAAERYDKLNEACAYLAFELKGKSERELRLAFATLFKLRRYWRED